MNHFHLTGLFGRLISPGQSLMKRVWQHVDLDSLLKILAANSLLRQNRKTEFDKMRLSFGYTTCNKTGVELLSLIDRGVIAWSPDEACEPRWTKSSRLLYWLLQTKICLHCSRFVLIYGRLYTMTNRFTSFPFQNPFVCLFFTTSSTWFHFVNPDLIML